MFKLTKNVLSSCQFTVLNSFVHSSCHAYVIACWYSSAIFVLSFFSVDVRYFFLMNINQIQSLSTSKIEPLYVVLYRVGRFSTGRSCFVVNYYIISKLISDVLVHVHGAEKSRQPKTVIGEQH